MGDAGLMDILGANIMIPKGCEGTCRSATGNYIMIDYFMASAGIVKASEQPRIREKWAPRPHHP
eukprot:6986456-Pyramimonas_sp.AAC.1